MLLLLSSALVVVVLAGTAVAGVLVRRREHALAELALDVSRHRFLVAERERFLASRESLAAAGDSGAAVVTVPTEVTRFGHQAIAAIPFTVLGQIPATAPASKVVRDIHDEISRTVYDAISGTARGVAGMMRGGLQRRPRPSPRPSPRPRPQPPGERPPDGE